MNGATLELLIRAALPQRLFLGVYHDNDFNEPRGEKDYIAVVLRDDDHWVLHSRFNDRRSVWDSAGQQKHDTCGAFVVIKALLLARNRCEDIDEELVLSTLEEWIRRISE